MAKQTGSVLNSGTVGSKGWGNEVLSILFTVFTIALVFGVILIAVVQSNTTLTSVQNQQDTFATVTVNSASALSMNIFSTGNFFISCSGCTNLATYPAFVTILTNTMTTNAANTLGNGAISASQTTYTLTMTSAAQQQISAVANVFTINVITVTGLSPADSGAVFTVSENWFPFQPNNGITGYPAAQNSISATGTVTVSQPTVGNSGQTPVAVFTALVTYLVTLSNFIGIIILLAIIVIVIGVLYYFFGNRASSGAFGGV